ncbi:MAG TPA: sensor histidine kinase [Candidatus Polarisedimenticolaceae bacterium]
MIGARIVVAILALLAGSGAAASTQRVLVLHSFGRDVEAHAAFSRIFQTELATLRSDRVEFHEISLGMTAIGGEHSEVHFADYLATFDAGHPFDLVVSIGGPAARFVQRHRRQLFANTPMLIAATDARHLSAGTVTERDAVVPVHVDLFANVQNVLRVLPETKEILVVLGNSPLEKFWLETFRSELRSFEDRVRITYLDTEPLDRILDRAEAAAPGTAIVYALLLQDAAGVPYGGERGLAAIRAVSRAPIFGLWEYQLGKGVVGGPVISVDELARISALVAGKILDGEPPSRFRLEPATAHRIVFDASELARWDIPRSRLLPGSEIRFEKPTLWELYWGRILAVAAFCVGQGALIVWLFSSRVRVRRAEAEIRDVSGRLVAAQEEERARLARELHDDVTQQIARLAIDAGRMEMSPAFKDGPEAATLRDLRAGLVRLSEHVHVLSYNLHPSLLDDLGLADAIQAEVDRVASQWAVTIEVDVTNLPDRTPSAPARCLFRVAQEALRNVVRHARARTVRVQLSGERRGIRLTVSDDGIGFGAPPEGRHRTLGLASMRERVRMAGGAFTVASVPGMGTTVDAWVPLAEKHA